MQSGVCTVQRIGVLIMIQYTKNALFALADYSLFISEAASLFIIHYKTCVGQMNNE